MSSKSKELPTGAKWGIGIAAIVLVLVVIGIIVYLLFFKKKTCSTDTDCSNQICVSGTCIDFECSDKIPCKIAGDKCVNNRCVEQ